MFRSIVTGYIIYQILYHMIYIIYHVTILRTIFLTEYRILKSMVYILVNAREFLWAYINCYMNIHAEVKIRWNMQIFDIKTEAKFEKFTFNRKRKNMNLSFLMILAMAPSMIISHPSVCNPKLTRQVCPVCAKFIQIHSNCLAQNNAIRIKAACVTLVQANCCSGIHMATKTSKNIKGSVERFASLPFALI